MFRHTENANVTRSELHTYMHTRVRTRTHVCTSAIFFNTRRKNKGFGYPDVSRLKLTSILYFLEHETGLSREMGSSSAPLLEKSDFIVRFVHAIVCSHFTMTRLDVIQWTYAKRVFTIYTIMDNLSRVICTMKSLYELIIHDMNNI